MKNAVLLTGSLIFYALGEPGYLVLLMVSVLANYGLGLNLGRSVRQKGKGKKQKKNEYDRKRKYLFAAAVAGNVGIQIGRAHV